MAEVWILICKHEAGRHIYPCESHEAALQLLDEYVTDWWGSTRGKIVSELVEATPGDPKRMSREECIKAYYEYWQDRRRETYEIAKHHVAEEG